MLRNSTKALLLTFLICMAFDLTAISIAHAGVADGYQAPTLIIPYAVHKPTLDGIIHDDEWRGAASVSALQSTDKKLSPRQTRFWIMWDENYIYIAMRSPLRPGERLLQALREQGHDVNVVFDDAYEIWLDAGTHSPDGEPVFFQYLSNYAGARYDVMFEPAVGNSRISWTAGWNPKNRLSADGRNWEMEMAIPRQSIYQTTPFTNGESLSCLLTRDYKRPWDQDSFAGSGSFSVRETYAKFVLSKTAPAVNLLSVGDPAAQTFGLQIGASGSQAQTLNWQYMSDGGVEKQGTLDVVPGEHATTPAMLDLDKPGDGSYRIKVESADNKTTYLDWSSPRQWGDTSVLTQKMDDTGDQVKMSLTVNPVRDTLRVTGDMIDYDDRAKIARYLVQVNDSAGKSLAQKELHIDSSAYVKDTLKLPTLAPGDYTATLTTYDSSGSAIFTKDSKFSIKDPASFPWWNTKVGDIDKVLSPWTPVKYAVGRFGVWDRTMSVGTAGLPQQIVTQNIPLLAGDARLIAQMGSGKLITAQPGQTRTISSADYRTVLESTGTLGKTIFIQSKVTVEFDGMYKVDMTLTPSTPTNVSTLQVVIPLKGDTATYLHACGEGIRYGFDYRFLPQDKTGELWNSRSIDGQPMTVGSFVPYVWIGNTEGGLAWFADSDEGWAPDNITPALSVRRNSNGTVDLVLNLVGKGLTISKPRTITFAFQATPVKPMPPKWRMHTWWTNDSFQDWAQVESEGHAGDEGLIFSSLPFPLDPAKSKEMVDERHKENNWTIFGIDKYRANAVPYFEHINMGEQFVPELTYFGDEWRTQVTRGLAYGKTLQDFMVYNVANWAKESGIDGFYIDNVSPIADDNIDAGRGYLLPDGRIQPAYQIFDTRRYFLRMRAALAEQGKSGDLVFHITNHMIAPWIGAADVALDGEDHVIYPEMGKDFMDFWSLERLRLDNPEQWGTPVNFLQEYQGSWSGPNLKTAMRAYTGMQLLGDTLASANANGQNQSLWIARDKFGIEAADVKFLSYWDQTNGLASKTKGVYVTGWSRPLEGSSLKLLLAVVNTGDAANANVELDFGKLGLGELSSLTAIDAETGQPVKLTSAGFTVSIPRHDYRQILIQPSLMNNSVSK